MPRVRVRHAVDEVEGQPYSDLGLLPFSQWEQIKPRCFGSCEALWGGNLLNENELQEYEGRRHGPCFP